VIACFRFTLNALFERCRAKGQEASDRIKTSRRWIERAELIARCCAIPVDVGQVVVEAMWWVIPLSGPYKTNVIIDFASLIRIFWTPDYMAATPPAELVVEYVASSTILNLESSQRQENTRISGLDMVHLPSLTLSSGERTRSTALMTPMGGGANERRFIDWYFTKSAKE
jgi:hypothetical protein